MLSYMWREALLRRDPVRATLALAGSLLLMFVIGFGISLDVEDPLRGDGPRPDRVEPELRAEPVRLALSSNIGP